MGKAHKSLYARELIPGYSSFRSFCIAYEQSIFKARPLDLSWFEMRGHFIQIQLLAGACALFIGQVPETNSNLTLRRTRKLIPSTVVQGGGGGC